MILNTNKTWKIIDSSKLKDHLRCQRFYFYCHVLGWKPEFPSNHLIFGTAWHLPMEHLLLNGYDLDSVNDGYSLFETSYRQHLGPDTDEMFGAKTPLNAFLALSEYADEYKDDLDIHKVKYTEIAGSASIGHNRDLYYRMDSILENRNNGLISSLEHKTGSRTWQWEDQWPLSLQIGTYTHVLHCLYDRKKVEGVRMNATFFIKRKKFKAEFMRPLIQKSLGGMNVWFNVVNYRFDLIEHSMEILDKESEDHEIMNSFPLNPEGCIKYGRICEYHDFCTAWPNPLKRCDEPPLGFKIEFWDPTKQEAKHEFKF